MVKYNCARCGYSTKYKGNFRSHLNRKTICPPIVSNIDINTVRKNYKMCKIKQKKGGTPTSPHVTPRLPPFLTKSCEFSEKQPSFSPHLAPIFNSNSPHLAPRLPPVFFENSQLSGVLDFSRGVGNEAPQKKVHGFFDNFDSEKIDDFEAKNAKKCSIDKIDKNEAKNVVKIDQKLRCEFCNKKFSSVKNRYRHQKHNCKVRRQKMDEEEKKLVKHEDTTDLAAQIKALKQEIRDMKTIKINVEKQQNIGNQQNIIINNYRSENIDYITDRVVETLIKRGPYASIPRLMETIHFNKKHPENHNLAITNVKSKFAHVRYNDTWQVKFLNELLEELVTTKFNIIDEYYEFGGLKDKLNKWKADSYENYRKELMAANSELRDKIKMKLFESIINFTKVLGLTHKKG